MNLEVWGVALVLAFIIVWIWFHLDPDDNTPKNP